MYATTQNRNRLGLTCAELLPYLAPPPPPSSSSSAGPGATNVVEHVDKMAFSMCVPAIMRHFGAGRAGSGGSGGSGGAAEVSPSSSFNGDKAGGDGGAGHAKAHGQAHEIAVVGIEAHVCVTQTVLDLLTHGHKVYILADGVSSSHPGEASTALERLRSAGAVVTTSESWLFEVMGDADIPESVFFFSCLPCPPFSSLLFRNQGLFFISYLISKKGSRFFGFSFFPFPFFFGSSVLFISINESASQLIMSFLLSLLFCFCPDFDKSKLSSKKPKRTPRLLSTPSPGQSYKEIGPSQQEHEGLQT